MPFYSWMLSSLLLCQISENPSAPIVSAPPTAAPSPVFRLEQASEQTDSNRLRSLGGPAATFPGISSPGGDNRGLAETRPIQSKQTPAAPSRATSDQLVADALTLPPGNTISGQPVPLLSVVATAPTRPQQIEAIHAYWRLAEAVAEYRFCFESQQRLARLRAEKDEAAEIRARQAVAAAQIREAEVHVTAAQHDLAEILLLAPNTPLPLPADRPLVGPYRTKFAELFSGQNAPQRARALDQTLPLRNQAIESHAVALLAAEDVLDAAIELQAGGQGRLADVAAALDVQLRQQRAFMFAVCRYNHDIADYALVAVSPQTSPELLVGTLIKQSRPPGLPVVPLPTSATLQASYPQVIVPRTAPAFRGAGIPSAYRNSPTRAPSPGAVQTSGEEAVDATSPGKATGALNPPAVLVPPNSPPGEDAEPRLAPPQESAIPLSPQNSAPAVPANRATPHTSRKPVDNANNLPSPNMSYSTVGSGAGTDNLPSPNTSYSTVGSGAGGEGLQAANLAAALYSVHGQMAGGTAAPRLLDCLRLVAAERRVDVVAAYWSERRLASQNQSLVNQIGWLDDLKRATVAQNPPSTTAVLRLRAARLAIEAELADTAADCRRADFELTDLTGGDREAGISQVASIPFVGQFPLTVASPNRPWTLRRLQATLPRLQAAIVDQAAVVIAADISRAVASADYREGRGSLDRVLAAINLQAQGTADFLRDVTDYNRAISQYLTATLPPNASAESFFAALRVGP
jgi:hypothetical protein